MAIDSDFEQASRAHTRKRGYENHAPGTVSNFNALLEVQDHVDLRAMAKADGKSIREFTAWLIDRERRRRSRAAESLQTTL